jgi:hypothetical protein
LCSGFRSWGLRSRKGRVHPLQVGGRHS